MLVGFVSSLVKREPEVSCRKIQIELLGEESVEKNELDQLLN